MAHFVLSLCLVPMEQHTSATVALRGIHARNVIFRPGDPLINLGRGGGLPRHARPIRARCVTFGHSVRAGHVERRTRNSKSIRMLARIDGYGRGTIVLLRGITESLPEYSTARRTRTQRMSINGGRAPPISGSDYMGSLNDYGLPTLQRNKRRFRWPASAMRKAVRL